MLFHIGAFHGAYLTCEKYYIFELLIFAGGMMGAYTYNLRGGVFCNAQTANVVLMALAFGHGQWQFFIVEKSADMRYNKLLNFSGVTGDYGKLVLAGGHVFYEGRHHRLFPRDSKR